VVVEEGVTVTVEVKVDDGLTLPPAELAFALEADTRFPESGFECVCNIVVPFSVQTVVYVVKLVGERLLEVPFV